MISKRGQITIFIIVGILLLAGALTFLALKSDIITGGAKERAEQAQEASQLSASVQNYIQSCLENTGKDALIFIGEQGGYYDLPRLSDKSFLLPYYFYNNETSLISKEELEKQLSLYVENELFFCIRNFVVFEDQGFEIGQKEVKATTKVAKNKVFFNVNFPVEIKKGETAKSVEKFSVEVPSRLGIIYDVVGELLEEQREDPGSICVSCITRLAIENDLRIEIVPIDNLMMFIITDEEVPINNQPYEYQFLNKYLFEEVELEEFGIEELELAEELLEEEE